MFGVRLLELRKRFGFYESVNDETIFQYRLHTIMEGSALTIDYDFLSETGPSRFHGLDFKIVSGFKIPVAKKRVFDG